MRRRRMTVRPTKGMIRFSRIFGVFFAVVAFLMLLAVLPTLHHGGLFGIVPVVMLVFFIIIGVVSACSKNGTFSMRGIEIEDETEEELPSGREARLQELQRLYDQRLITQEEYEEKRKEILKEL